MTYLELAKKLAQLATELSDIQQAHHDEEILDDLDLIITTTQSIACGVLLEEIDLDWAHQHYIHTKNWISIMLAA